MTVLTQSYPLKLPQDITLRHQLDMLRDLVLHAAQQLLEDLPTSPQMVERESKSGRIREA